MAYFVDSFEGKQVISVFKEMDNKKIVMTPNRSMTWRGNQLVLLSLVVISTLIGTGFALIGAWVILPFAGIELMLLTIALYYVSWKLSYCHVLLFDKDGLIVEKGDYFPRQRWRFSRRDVSFRVCKPKHDWDGPELHLITGQESISLGEFLSKSDRLILMGEIRASSIPVRQGNHVALPL